MPERAAATQPFLGPLPSERCGDHICPHPMGLPASPLPIPSSLGDTRVCTRVHGHARTRTHTHTHTHILPLMRVLLFDVQSGSLAGSLYLGESGRLVPRGAKEGQGIPGGELGGHHNPCPLQEQLLLPTPTPTPTKRWPLFTVRLGHCVSVS